MFIFYLREENIDHGSSVIAHFVLRSANSVSTYIIHSLCRFTSTSFTSYMTDYNFLFSLCLVVYIPFISLEILDWEFGKLLPD